MRIDCEFEGGNIDVLAIEGDCVRVAAQLRDTEGDWFYWAFRVTGAEGRRLTFDFGDKVRIGYYGAAVSSDNANWRWSNTANATHTQFSYSFGEQERVVYFCHHMRYGTGRFYSLADRLGLPVKTLAVSEKGRPVPYVRFGCGCETILLTARHHACESTGDYVLEGILEELRFSLTPGLSVIAVPFVDMDGVTDGDQGKNRMPHDHNRDYAGNSLYAAVAAIRAMAASENVIYQFDLHSPWHFGGRHDVCFGVRGHAAADPAQAKFGALLEEEARRDPDAFQYRTENDLPINCEWNIESDLAVSCSSFFTENPGMRLSLTLETAYFGLPGNVVSQDNLIALGRAMGKAILRFYRLDA